MVGVAVIGIGIGVSRLVFPAIIYPQDKIR